MTLSHRFLSRLLLAHFALAAFLAFPLEASAQRRPPGPPHHPPGHDRDRWDDRYDDRWDSGRDRFGRDEVVRLRLSERTFRGTTVPLLQLAQQQGIRLQGREVLAVSLDAEALGRFADAEARLVVNGVPQGAFQYLFSRRDQVNFYLYGQSEIGRDIRQLQIEVRGEAQLHGVSLTLAPERRPGPAPLPPTIFLRPMRDFYGRVSQSLETAFAIPFQHSNRMVAAVTITALSNDRGEYALVEIGGRGPLLRQFLDRFARTQRISFPRPVPLHQIGINMLNHVRVESVEVEFLR